MVLDVSSATVEDDDDDEELFDCVDVDELDSELTDDCELWLLELTDDADWLLDVELELELVSSATVCELTLLCELVDDVDELDDDAD